MTDPRLAARHLDPEKLRRLADDVERINFGEGPSQKELAAAPRLEGWSLVPIRLEASVLVGSVRGHPRIGESRLIRTSELIALDAPHRWARSFSRWYALGRQAMENDR